MFLTTLLATLWLVSITIFTPTQAGSFTKFCDDQPTSAINYTREVIGTSHDYIMDMDVSHHTGNIYIVDSKFTMQVIYKGEQTTKPINIEGTKSVEALAVDKHEPKVYIGWEHGLQAYNELTTDIEIVPHLTEIHITALFLPKDNKHIYAIDYDRQIYRYHNITSRGISLNISLPREYLYRFVVDADDNYYYATKENETAVSKVVLKGKSNPIIYKGDLMRFDVDNAGRVYYTHGRKLYHMEAGGTKSQFIMTLDFDPWHLRFDKDNNIIIGSSDKKIFIYKFQYHCVSQPTQAISNISEVLSSINTIQNNITKGFDDIKRELNKTNLDNINLHNSVISEMKSVKKSNEEESNTHNNEILELKNEIIELKQQNAILKENIQKNAETNNEILNYVVGENKYREDYLKSMEYVDRNVPSEGDIPMKAIPKLRQSKL